jgi:predicted GNAT superfamily acetyltransferase
LHSHILGVLPAWRRQQIGLRLKLAEREAVLEQGLTDLMTWAFDPLICRNASLNLHRLGATCNIYQRDVLHEFGDRFWVDWSLCSPSILQSVDSPRPVQEWDISLLNRLPIDIDGQFERPVDAQLRLDGRPLAIPLPADIAPIRQADATLAHDWILYQRAMLSRPLKVGLPL